MTLLAVPRRLVPSLLATALVVLALVLVPISPVSAATQGTIHGTVTGPDGTPLEGIEVDFYGDNDGYGSTYTDATGAYSLQLDPESGVVMFYDDAGTYASEFWDDTTAYADATHVTVTGSGVIEADAQLALAGHVTGHIQDTAGDPIPYVLVEGYTFDGSAWVPADLASGFTDQNGDYDFSGPVGTYRLEFTPMFGDYVTEFYDDVRAVGAATSLTTTSAAPVTGIDAVLAPASGVSGTVTLPAGADPLDTDGTITVVDSATGQIAARTWLDPSSETAPDSHTYPWSVGGLPAGSYRVEFAHEDGWSTSEAEFYNDHPESAGSASADVVTLTAGQHRTGVNAVLRAGGTISGKLVNAAGTPIAGCEVGAFRPDGTRVRRLGTSNADGTFQVTGLTAGSYSLAVVDYDGSTNLCPTIEYYTNANGDLSPSYAGLLSVSAGPGTNLALPAPLVYGGDLPSQTAALQNTAAPAVVGIPRVGQELKAYAGTWSPQDPSTALQWLRNGAPVPGATGSSYLLGADDLGAAISLRVTATKDGYASAQRTSDPTSAVGAGILTLTDVPRLLGRLKVGKVLSALPPTASPTATAVRFQWLRNGVAIKGLAAKRARYKLVRADRGKHISVRITVLRPGYAPTASIAKRAGKVR